VRDNRIHAVFMVHGTSTGRLSSRNPNMQNISNDVEGAESLRRCYIATPGKVMVGADYSQAELRVMAELSGDPQMIADLSSDVDFFDNMMPDVFGPDIMKLDKAGRKPYRLRLKRIVYGLSYNRKAGAIAEQLTIEDGTPTTRTEAQAIIDGYLGRYPVFAAWRLSIMPQVLNGELRTVFGRRYQQDVVTNSNYVPVENSALAFPPQSTASDLCLLAAIRLHKELPDGAHMVNLVHDALYTECWPEQAEYVKDLTQRLMEESAREYFSRVTFSTEGKIGLTWDSV
jgi:DNA polymerase-1